MRKPNRRTNDLKGLNAPSRKYTAKKPEAIAVGGVKYHADPVRCPGCGTKNHDYDAAFFCAACVVKRTMRSRQC
jgi:hypothetical protein